MSTNEQIGRMLGLSHPTEQETAYYEYLNKIKKEYLDSADYNKIYHSAIDKLVKTVSEILRNSSAKCIFNLQNLPSRAELEIDLTAEERNSISGVIEKISECNWELFTFCKVHNYDDLLGKCRRCATCPLVLDTSVICE